MFRSVLSQAVPQKLPQRQAVSTPPGNAALRIQPLEVTHKDHAEVDPWRNPRPTVVFVIRFAQRLDEFIKAAIAEQTIQSVVKHVTDRARQFRRGHPKLFLPLRPAMSQSHPVLLDENQSADRIALSDTMFRSI